MEKVYRVCVIGCGVIAPNHIQALLENERTQLLAVCDIREERAKDRAKMGKCAFYTDYKEMIAQEKPDAVHICLPHYLHASVSIYALEHGCDVMCEKPMALCAQEGQAMIDAAQKNGRRLGVIFQNRYNPENRAILSAMQSGELGAVQAVRGEVCWHRDQVYYETGDWRSRYETAGGGVIINQAIHTLDLLRVFAGSPVQDVCATVSHHGDTTAEVEDTAEGVIRFENGVRGLFYFSINNWEDEAIRVTVKCEKARIDMHAGACRITYTDGRETTVDAQKEAVRFTGAKLCYGSSHAVQIDDFYSDADGSRAVWMQTEALATQKLVDAIFAASGSVHP